MNNEHQLLRTTGNLVLPNKPGVYLLVNTKNNKVYIGCTSNIRKRVATHRSLLLNHNHFNEELKQAFFYDNLEIKVLATLTYVNNYHLRELERVFIQASPILFPEGLMNKKIGRTIFGSEVE